MLLDALRDFEWYNDPENVRFTELGMEVSSRPKTDFWQSIHHNFRKDDGHFFYGRTTENFTLTVKWSFDGASLFDQCGLMLRIDERNWFKAGIMTETSAVPKIGSSATNSGYSDWALLEVPYLNAIWFKLKRNGGDYIAYYSLDGNTYKQMRLFHLINDVPEVKVGAYICSPQHNNFSAILETLSFE